MNALIGWIIIISIAVSSFIGINDNWTFKRAINRVSFNNYSKTSKLKDVAIKDTKYIVTRNIKTIFNKVIITNIISEPMSSKELRTFERNMAKDGGVENVKEEIIKHLAQKSMYVDLLQQGLELEFIWTDSKIILIDLVVTYEDISKYWKVKK